MYSDQDLACNGNGSVWESEVTYSLHCSSFLGLPCRILNIDLLKPKKGTTMETFGKVYSVINRIRVHGPLGTKKKTNPKSQPPVL